MMLNKNLFPVKFRSLKIFKNKKDKIEIRITNNNFLYERDVKKNFVLIKVSYSNINYKDLLMCKNDNNFIKKFPHTPGIDSSGVIYYSKSNKFKKNEKVFIIAQPLGVKINGSFSQFILVPDSWVNKLSKNMSLKEIMMMGTSGFTAVKAFNIAKKKILKLKNKPVLITGATGNVGMYLVFLLSNIGVKIEAITSTKENQLILKKMGVIKTFILKDFLKTQNYALLNEKYSVIFDNIGGNLFSSLLKYLIQDGMFISIGNIMGNISKINILPLILRGVNIIGVNSESSKFSERKKIFKSFESNYLKKALVKRTKVIKLRQISSLINSKIFQKKVQRYIVKTN